MTPSYSAGKLFDSQAKGYANYRHGYSAAALAYIKERTQLSPASSLLDLACGTGVLLSEFTGEAALACGLDSSLAMLQQVDRSGERPPCLTQGTAYTLPFPDNLFDVITIGQAIHWFKLEQLIPELSRVLRPAGWLVIISKYPAPSEPYRYLFEHLIDRYQTRNTPGRLRLTNSYGAGNVLGLEAAGFTAYERRTFTWEVKTPIETYVIGCSHDPRVQALGEELLPAFQAELKQALRQEARSDVLNEVYFDYVISAQRRAIPLAI